MNCGIYRIINIVDGSCYIGSSLRGLDRRRNEHFCDLRKKRHTNSYLQNAWNKHGESNFKFEILEIIEYPAWYPIDRKSQEILDIEQWYLDYLKPEYNIAPRAHNMSGMKHSLESKHRMSEARRNNPRPSAMLGKKHTDHTKSLMSRAHKGRIVEEKTKIKLRGSNNGRAKLIDQDIIFIRALIKDGIKKEIIAKQFNVSASTISHIDTKRIWRNV